jgi:hypothetical protein
VRCNFVVAAHPEGRFANRPYSLDYARLASGAFYETIVPVNFHDFIIFGA